MRVTFVAPHDNAAGGMRVVAEYAHRLTQRGHRVSVVCQAQPPIKTKDKIRSLVKTGAMPKPKGLVRTSYFADKAVTPTVIDGRRPIVDGDIPDADVVFATWWDTAEWVASYGKAKGAKCYFLQGLGGAGQPEPPFDDTLLLPLNVLTISQWLRQTVLEYSGRDCAVVPNGIDLDTFNAPARDKNSRPTIGLMCTTNAEKGPDISLRAAELARERLGLEFDLVGFGRLDANLPQHLIDQVDCVGPVDDAGAVDVYKRCDAWLFGSRIEGYGLPILEAMACRTPVIGAPAGAAPELINDQTGLLMPHLDCPWSMANGIKQIIEMPNEQWQAMSAAARAEAEKYTWDRAVDGFEAFMDRAANG